ncbi:MAG: DUF1987 domain-containing protein [Bacteroidales bacterium]|nr:DUF1987 domain-containing protein [Bacteroidales bacterium]
MNSLYCKPTSSTPEVNFDVSGHLSLTGKSLPENSTRFYQPLKVWLESYNGDAIIFNVKLEYFNSSSSKELFELLKVLIEHYRDKNCTVNWYYEEGDDDTFEIGQYFEELLDFNFRYFVFQEADNAF